METVIELIVPMLAAGCAAGLLAGLLGIGGGIVMVPVLSLLLDVLGVGDAVSMHVAIATSMATIIFTGTASAWAHTRRGNVEPNIVRRWAPFIIVGALCGGLLARQLNGDVLRALFFVLALGLAARFLLGRGPDGHVSLSLGRLAERGVAALIGLFSTWLGIGGGSFSVPLLNAMGRPVHKAIGTSAAIGVLIALPSVAGFVWSGAGVAGRPDWSAGYVHLPSALALAACAMAFAPLGARLSSSLDQRRLKQLFGLFLLVAAGRMLFKILN